MTAADRVKARIIDPNLLDLSRRDRTLSGMKIVQLLKEHDAMRMTIKMLNAFIINQMQ